MVPAIIGAFEVRWWLAPSLAGTTDELEEGPERAAAVVEVRLNGLAGFDVDEVVGPWTACGDVQDEVLPEGVKKSQLVGQTSEIHLSLPPPVDTTGVIVS